MSLSPFEIGLLMHFYTSESAHEKQDANIAQECIREWLKEGVIASITTDYSPIRTYRTTELGGAWVRAILRTPQPRIAYLDEHGREIPSTP